MEQTVMQVGNSLAVTLPKKFVVGKKIKARQTAYTDFDEYEGIITVYFKKSDYEKDRNENIKFRKMIRDFNLRYKDILDNLPDRRS